MAPLTSAKHQVGEIDNTRCTIIESGITEKRMEFIRDLLTFNKLDVKVRQEAADEASGEPLYTVGVTDIVFNPVYAIYERTLLNPHGSVVTPAYYRQLEGDTSVQYWMYGRKEPVDLYE